MTFPMPESEIRRLTQEMCSHLPAGLMRSELVSQAETHLIQAFEALVAYYAGDEETRADIRGFFYALATGESWNDKKDGPTSGELAEQAGQIKVPDLPEELVKLCREKLMTLVQEHSQAPDLEAGEFNDYLGELGIRGTPDADEGNDS